MKILNRNQSVHLYEETQIAYLGQLIISDFSRQLTGNKQKWDFE